jgi:HSP20 family molecular chaperone IbpA
MFDMDLWMKPLATMGPSTLDVFDPFDELDRIMSRNLQWINMPESMKELKSLIPRVPKKWRVQLDVKGFKPKSIKCNLSEDNKKLIITAHEGDESRKQGDNYTVKEMKRTFNLPKHCEVDKMISFVTPTGKLIVEIPQTHGEKGVVGVTEELLPKIVEGEKGMKNVHLNIHMPENIDPSKIKVTCKDRDLIVQAEEKSETADTSSQFYYYRRSTLPENTDLTNLKCHLDKNHNLTITAPIQIELRSGERSIPVEMKKSIQ